MLFPPNLPNYVIKNECIAFDKISLGRRKVINDLRNQVKEFKTRMKIYESNPQEYCGPKRGKELLIIKKYSYLII